MRPSIRSHAFLLAAGAAAAGLWAGSAPVFAHPHVWVATKSEVIFQDGALYGLRFTWTFDEMYTASAVDGLDVNKDGKFDASELEELTKVNIEGLKEFDYFTTVTLAGQPVPLGDARDYGMEVLEVDEPPGPQMVAGPSTGPSAGSANGPSDATGAPVTERRGLWSRFTGWLGGMFGRSRTADAAGTAQPAAAPAPEKTKVLSLYMTLPLKSPIPAAQLGSADKGFQFVTGDGQMYIWFEPLAKDGVALAPGAPAGCRLASIEPEPTEEQKKLQEAFGRVGGGAPISGQGKVAAVVCGTN